MHDNTEISLPLYFVLSVPLLFPIDKTETASQEEMRCQEQINFTYPDIARHEIEEGNAATFFMDSEKTWRPS